MSVAEHLGLDDPTSNELIHRASRRWPGWCTSDPRLAVVTDPLEVQRWTLTADRNHADEVLRGLATLAASDGGNDRAAAMVLCWTMLPAAARLAQQLRGLTPHIDDTVAAQLWVETRTFPWQRLRKVAANIRANTRAGVLRHCGDRARLPASDRAWGHTFLVEPTARLLTTVTVPTQDADEPTAAQELVEVLAWARREHVITGEDEALLLSLVEAAQRTAVTSTRRGHGGLLANALSEQVALLWGISPITVRRRAGRSLRALAVACRHGRYVACA